MADQESGNEAPKAAPTVAPAVAVESPAAPAKKTSTLHVVLMSVAGIAIGVGALFFLKGGSIDDLKPSSTIRPETEFKGEIEGARMVVVDAPKLVQAAIAAQMIRKQEGFSGEIVGKVVRQVVDQYRADGYIVLAAGNTVGYPQSADITPMIAQKLGIDLGDAELGMRLMEGQNVSGE